jgi:hypothetical protein
MRTYLAAFCIVIILLATPLCGQQEVFNKVTERCPRSVKDPRLINKDVHLVLDATSGKLMLRPVLEPTERSLEIKYADVSKVIFEVTTHGGSGIPLGRILSVAL